MSSIRTSSNHGLVIDRRGQSADKNIGNDQRFRRRQDAVIKNRIDKLLDERKLEDATNEAVIKGKFNVSEPTFSINQTTGDRTIVVPGNKHYQRGDLIDRPESGAGSGNGQGDGGGGEGVDDFIFRLSKQDMLEYLFNDLELPNLERRKLIDTEDWHYRRAGFSRSGNPSLVHIGRSFKEGLARRIASKGGLRLRLEELEKELAEYRRLRLYGSNGGIHDPKVVDLMKSIEELKGKIVPYHLEDDLRYRRQNAVPEPSTQAVMFCVMDVSGSMGEEEKLIAKKFFLLLHLFLTTAYKKVRLVFIRHTDTAEEVDQHTFFYDRKTGGTIVSSALVLMNHIIEERFNSAEWNVYCAQISDGDNMSSKDSALCAQIIGDSLLPKLQYLAYMEVKEHSSDLWSHYEAVAEQHPSEMSMVLVNHQREIYPVFRQLFARKEKTK